MSVGSGLLYCDLTPCSEWTVHQSIDDTIRHESDQNPFDLIKRQLLLRPIVELSCSRRFVPCDTSGGLDIATVAKELRNARTPVRVIADLTG